MYGIYIWIYMAPYIHMWIYMNASIWHNLQIQHFKVVPVLASSWSAHMPWAVKFLPVYQSQCKLLAAPVSVFYSW